MAEKIEGFYLNGTEYEIGGSEYNAGEGISIEDISMNGRQGPSQDGFHVPAAAEWQGVNTIMTSLSLTTGDSWRINLHMPFAGIRSYSNAADSHGSNGNYWSSTSYGGGTPYYAYMLSLRSSNASPGTYLYRAYGCSIRCFKDSYVSPDSSWTVVQGSLGSAGIFWNQSEGLISITNGTTGYTIMDKNLGATTVYNDGDELTEANCGKFYQWGNNYGFSFTGNVATSSTKVNASGYGPNTVNGYYESNIFIIKNDDWDSDHNGDLWGDITGTITQENVISNTGVLSVNGQTGNVTVQSGSEASGVTTTQPSNPVAGSTYYDTTAGTLKVYNGTSREEVGGTEYTAGNGIDITNDEIGLDGTYERDSGGKDYSAMQGPAPSGFHVPLVTEWEGLRAIMNSRPLKGDSWGITLHMPFPGRRDTTSGTLFYQGSNGYYWSSSPYEFYQGESNYLFLNSSRSDANDGGPRSFGCSIRCFKNSYVAPTSSWTVIKGTLGSAGIFWNQSEGLISVTNGTTGYTIMDKNLGATTVYNNGDTLTQANMGNMYQWGNNYGFPSTGTVNKKSSTQVNASNYGPGNYYESDTFIKTNGDWSSVRNDNLRGGETGVQPIMISGNLTVGDKLYKIVTSTTAPASGTANNIITIVTD